MSYETENKELLDTLLESTFFGDFRNGETGGDRMFGNLELQLTSKCNLKCSYCYYSDKGGHGNELNNPVIATWSTINKNADMIFAWLTENNYYPKGIDIFSGDTLIHNDGYYVIEKAIDFYAVAGVKGNVIIPSNMTFIKNPILVEKIEGLIEKGRKNGVGVFISASIDGKFADPISRQTVKDCNQEEYYDDKFYDDVFIFCKKHGYSFHPMMSPENIHVWKKNFGWFQEMLKKYDMPWNSIYMLEVRNDGWTVDDVRIYGEFYRSVLNFSLDMIKDCDVFRDRFMFTPRRVSDEKIGNMNLFNNLSQIGRGIGCSLQTTLFVKLADLTCNSCHRLSYDALNGFRFVVNNDKIVDVKPMNLSFYIATMSYDQKSAPYCESCLIKGICNGGCLGAQLEFTEDTFSPIPSVCKLLHKKVLTQYQFFKETDMFEQVMSSLNKDAYETFKQIERLTK